MDQRRTARTKLVAQLEVAPRALVWAAATVTMLAIAGVDARLGSEISTSIFYVLPVGIASWYSDRVGGVLFSLASAGLWLLADLTAASTTRTGASRSGTRSCVSECS